MPQLDVVTFFSQFFWLCIFYIGFYYILYKYFLPQYSRSILFRDKFTYSSSIQKNANLEEKGNIEESLSLFQNSLVSSSKNFFLESKNNTLLWQNITSKKTNQVDWKTANLLYIKSFGVEIAKKNLEGNSISISCGKNIYLFGLSKKCKNYKAFFDQSSSTNNTLKASTHSKISKKTFSEEKQESEKAKQKNSVKSLAKPSQKKVSRSQTKITPKKSN